MDTLPPPPPLAKEMQLPFVSLTHIIEKSNSRFDSDL